MENGKLPFSTFLLVAWAIGLKYHLAGIRTGLSKSTKEGKML
jgi:hypothetical protein